MFYVLFYVLFLNNIVIKLTFLIILLKKRGFYLDMSYMKNRYEIIKSKKKEIKNI